jgi:TPR repeat protein
MYEKGRGFDSDEKKAFDLFLNAAHEDNTNTQFEVGRMYLDGTVVVKDDDV